MCYNERKEGKTMKMTFESFDKKPIAVHVWEAEHPVAVVQIVHGMTEHAARYAPFARFLNGHGYTVAADDHRGHGETDTGTLGWCKGDMFADTVRDEAALTDFLKKTYGVPVFLFGFSYGSFLTQSYLGKYSEKIAGAIIAGSSYKKDFEVYLGSVVAGLGCAFCGEKKPAKLIEKLSFGAYAGKFADGEWLSADAENNAAYHADPFCGFTCSFRFYADFFRGLRRLYTGRYRAGLKKELPLLLASGAQDPVGAMGRGVKKLYAFYTRKAGMTDVSLALFEGSRHEFLNEKQDRDRKWGTVLDFLRAHTQGTE